MALQEVLSVFRVEDEEGRLRASEVLTEIYEGEKGWTTTFSKVPPTDVGNPDVSWFVVTVDGRAAGILRVNYKLPVQDFAKYGYQFLVEGIDVEAFLSHNKIVELGRFCVLKEYRRNFAIMAHLMRAATNETIRRGSTHMLTEVLEADPQNPFLFYTRVFGFTPVATHETGELDFVSRRITMLLEIQEAYERLKGTNTFIYRMMTDDWDDEMHARFAALPAREVRTATG